MAIRSIFAAVLVLSMTGCVDDGKSCETGKSVVASASIIDLVWDHYKSITPPSSNALETFKKVYVLTDVSNCGDLVLLKYKFDLAKMEVEPGIFVTGADELDFYVNRRTKSVRMDSLGGG